jgi:hypothetical protein
VLYIAHKVIYSNTTLIYIVKNTQFGCEPSSGQYLIYGHGAFSEYVHYGIPYCLQTIFLIPSLKSIDWMYF